MKILLTGSAGFIGFHVARKLLKKKNTTVVGIDNLNKYYDVKLKKQRLKILKSMIKKNNFYFFKADISKKKNLNLVFKKFSFDAVIHLAAQAGVRYSILNPEAYVKSNLVGFYNILNLCKHYRVKHLLYASTSSVYGANRSLPFKETNPADHPLQFYAATKRANELMAHSYSCLYGIPTTALRFFTVYGPWGRPDMSLFKFTENIIKKKPIDLFNKGNHSRDFTYIDDVVIAIIKLIAKRPKKKLLSNRIKLKPNISFAPFQIYNIGNSNPVNLKVYIKEIEKQLGIKAKLKILPKQSGDMKDTYANINLLQKKINFKPKTSIKLGVKKFISWYIKHYKKD